MWCEFYFISVFVVLLRTDAGFYSYQVSHDLKENLRGSWKLLHWGSFYYSCLDSHSVFRFVCGLAVIFIQPWLLITRVSTEPFTKGFSLFSAVPRL